MLAANYTVPATVTIPANSNEGVLTITTIGNGLNLSLAKTIVLNLVGEEGLDVGSALTIKNAIDSLPQLTIERSIKGMLSTTETKRLMRRLNIYTDENHPHMAQNPIKLDLNNLSFDNKKVI